MERPIIFYNSTNFLLFFKFKNLFIRLNFIREFEFIKYFLQEIRK